MNSEVFLATDPQLAGTIVVKEIPKASLCINPADYYREAQAMFASSHDHVVRIHYACETSDRICLAMPYYARGSLADRLASGPLRLSEVIRIGDGILTGLARIHVAGFLHLDLKPTNVLFSDADVPMVADLGQACAIGSHGVTIAGPMYCFGMPPEYFLHSRAVSVESDVYQTGLTLYRMANGDEAFDAQKPSGPWPMIADAITQGRFPDRDAFLPHVPRAARTVIKKALSVDPCDRYHSATELAAALGKVSVDTDWDTYLAPTGDIRWRARPPNRTEIVVDLRGHGSHHAVESFTVSAGRMRARKKALWKSGLTRSQAMAHLQRVFPSLG